jgi:lipoate-protein ligase A
MKDIVGAMAKEREYLSFRMKGEEPYHFVDAVKEYGFESLEEYFNAKKDYEFSQLKFEVFEAQTESAVKDVITILKAKKTAVLFVPTDKTVIWNGNQGEYDASYCEKCNIPIYFLGTSGGTIVTTEGDINIGICYPKTVRINERFILDKIADILRKYTYKPVEVVGNDVLAGGVKVIGSSVYVENGQFMFVAVVSMTDKSELIQSICKKHSEKQPGYIDFMNKHKFREEVEKWLRVNCT